MKRIIFKVTQYRIRNGKKMNTRRCPVAATINAQFNDGYYAKVDTSEIEVFKRNGIMPVLTITAPRSVVRFVDKYDDDKAVKPFNFRITVPADALKQIA